VDYEVQEEDEGGGEGIGKIRNEFVIKSFMPQLWET
jgi:hypothetical protein